MDLTSFAAFAGALKGANRLFDPPLGTPTDSELSGQLSVLLGGRFVRLDYTWSYEGVPQEGSWLLGEEKTGPTGHWIDAWHNGKRVMACSGAIEGQRLVLRGVCPVRVGPDWRWRTEFSVEGSTLLMEMWNVWPEGEDREEAAVIARFERA